MSCMNTLKEHGLKLTPQRRLIVDIIHDADSHITAEDIITKVNDRMPGINKSTVYRTLELLEKSGCVYKSEMDNQSIYHHVEEGHHHHLICSECGKVIDSDENLFAPMERFLADKYGFYANFKHLVMSGLCEECGNKEDR
jgi:Fur family ferric uptake transcriptional regulator